MRLLKNNLIFLSILSISLSLFFSSCSSNSKDAPEINLENKMSWAETNVFSTPEDAESLNFIPIKNAHDRNFWHTVGKKGKYIWIKINFTIPEELQNQDLGFIIEYLHFAEKTWINGRFVGQYGSFPPYEKSALWTAHQYDLPTEILNSDSENTILIKVWCHGFSKISKKVFITDINTATYKANYITYMHSKVFIFFEGGMFAAFLLFFILFLGRRQESNYIVFALTNLFTLQLGQILFAQESPFYNLNSVNYLTYIKYFECICFIFSLYFLQSFVIRYIHNKPNIILTIIRLFISLGCSVAVICAPSYNVLMDMSIPIMIILFLQTLIPITYLVSAFINPNYKSKAIIITIGLTPFFICVLADFILRLETFERDIPPFHSFYGWQMTIIFFLIVLTVRFNKTLSMNEYLNKHLSLEVDKKTAALKESKKELEEQLDKNSKDLKMASIVQQKFFPAPSRNFIGWSLSIAYNPLNEVSGDLYDYYTVGNILQGFAMFDVSGHGISSSLITVLAKNILSQIMKQNHFTNQNSSMILKTFNKQLNDAKGAVDNYLTGIICTVKKLSIDGSCSMQLSNAGHPHPILYNAQSNKISELRPEKGIENFGAIGLYGSNINFTDLDFSMNTGDILVVYTDGVTEALNQNGEQFGKARLMEIIQQNYNKTSAEIQECVMDELIRFIGTKQRNDDITVFVLKREKPENFIEDIG